MQHVPPAPQSHLTVEITELASTLRRAGLMLVETVVIPTALLALLLHYVGLVAGLCAVLGWCALVVGGRYLLRCQLPGTLLLCTSMLCGRACVALLTSSAVVFVLQPALGSLLTCIVFVGSAVIGRPITARLARDFVRLPVELFARRGVHRVFVQVALMWGLSRLLDAAMTVGFLNWGIEAGLLSRGVLSGLLTALTVLACTVHGWRKMRQLPDVTLRFGWRGAPA